MGKDKNGKDVIAHIPRDLEWLKSLRGGAPGRSRRGEEA
jgi:hypothetical protein